MTVKPQKIGDSWFLPLPAAITVAKAMSFTVTQQLDGSIVYTPEHANPFEGDWFKQDLKQTYVTTEVDEFSYNEWSYSAKKD